MTTCCRDCTTLGEPPPHAQLAARALSTAITADIEAATPLKRALLKRQIQGPALARIILRDLYAARGRVPRPALFPNIRKVAGMILQSEGRPADGLGQFDAIAAAIGAAAGAAASIYSAKTNADAQKQLIAIEQQKATAQIQMAQLQAKAAQTQLASANLSSSITTGTMGPEISGVPIIPILLGLSGLGVGIYFMTKR